MNCVNVELIKNYLKENKITKDFCNKSGISISVLYKILNGKNFVITAIFRIAKTMNVRVCELFKSEN